MDHAFFIVSSYIAAIVIVGALIAMMVVDHRMQKRTLAELEARRGRQAGGAAQSPAAASKSA